MSKASPRKASRTDSENLAKLEVARLQRKDARREARERAGLTHEQVAKHLRRSVPYIKQIERNGRATPYLAIRLSRLYKCAVEIFVM